MIRRSRSYASLVQSEVEHVPRGGGRERPLDGLDLRANGRFELRETLEEMVAASARRR